jgi:hypothetical protein
MSRSEFFLGRPIISHNTCSVRFRKSPWLKTNDKRALVEGPFFTVMLDWQWKRRGGTSKTQALPRGVPYLLYLFASEKAIGE